MYEVIWEDGSHSLANYADDDEMKSAVLAHHGRALKGEQAGPAGGAAGRIVKVFKYDSDPAESDDTLSKDVAKAELNALIDEAADENGVLDLGILPNLVSALRTSQVNSGPHESNYKAESTAEFSIEDLEGGDSK
jgi:hypothetical protein